MASLRMMSTTVFCLLLVVVNGVPAVAEDYESGDLSLLQFRGVVQQQKQAVADFKAAQKGKTRAGEHVKAITKQYEMLQSLVKKNADGTVKKLPAGIGDFLKGIEGFANQITEELKATHDAQAREIDRSKKDFDTCESERKTGLD